MLVHRTVFGYRTYLPTVLRRYLLDQGGLKFTALIGHGEGNCTSGRSIGRFKLQDDLVVVGSTTVVGRIEMQRPDHFLLKEPNRRVLRLHGVEDELEASFVDPRLANVCYPHRDAAR